MYSASSPMSSPRSRKRRQIDPHDVDAIVQVLAKLLLADHLVQVAGRGGHDPHVDVDLLAAADAANLALLQRAQQLGLQQQRQLAQLVEKERALDRQIPAARSADFRRR